MPRTPNNIRDLRESKNLSQDKVAEAAGVTYNVFVRIERGTGKTTPEEVKAVMDVLKEMEPGTRKLAGRPFKDPETQAAVKAARESGGSVAEVLGLNTKPKAAAPKKATTPRKPAATPKPKAAAPKKATTPRKKATGKLADALAKATHKA